MKFCNLINVVTYLALSLSTSSCISKSIDVSDEPLYRKIIGQEFITKTTCKLVEYDSSEHPVAEYIARTGKNGELTYLAGGIGGQHGKDFILDNQVFIVERIIRRHSFEYDYLKVIGYFPALDKRIDVGILFIQKPTNKGTIILIDNNFLQAVEK